MAKTNKYGANKATYEGIEFDSRREMRQYIVLLDMERRGEISNLRRQVRYELLPPIWEDVEVQLKTKTKTVRRCVQRAVSYLADFVYEDVEGRTVVVDAKGMRTKEYMLKKKMMRSLLGIEIEEV